MGSLGAYYLTQEEAPAPATVAAPAIVRPGTPIPEPDDRTGTGLLGFVGNAAADIRDVAIGLGRLGGMAIGDVKDIVTGNFGDVDVLTPAFGVQMVQSFVEDLGERYGPLLPGGEPWTETAESFYENPLSFVFDALAVAGGAGAVARGATGVARWGDLARTSGLTTLERQMALAEAVQGLRSTRAALEGAQLPRAAGLGEDASRVARTRAGLLDLVTGRRQPPTQIGPLTEQGTFTDLAPLERAIAETPRSVQVLERLLPAGERWVPRHRTIFGEAERPGYDWISTRVAEGASGYTRELYGSRNPLIQAVWTRPLRNNLLTEQYQRFALETADLQRRFQMGEKIDPHELDSRMAAMQRMDAAGAQRVARSNLYGRHLVRTDIDRYISRLVNDGIITRREQRDQLIQTLEGFEIAPEDIHKVIQGVDDNIVAFIPDDVLGPSLEAAGFVGVNALEDAAREVILQGEGAARLSVDQRIGLLNRVVRGEIDIGVPYVRVDPPDLTPDLAPERAAFRVDLDATGTNVPVPQREFIVAALDNLARTAAMADPERYPSVDAVYGTLRGMLNADWFSDDRTLVDGIGRILPDVLPDPDATALWEHYWRQAGGEPPPAGPLPEPGPPEPVPTAPTITPGPVTAEGAAVPPVAEVSAPQAPRPTARKVIAGPKHDKDVKIGHVYRAKIGDRIVDVRIDGDSVHGGWTATNLTTNRTVRIRSARKLRSEVIQAEEAPTPQEIPVTPEEIAPVPEAPRAVLQGVEAPVEGGLPDLYLPEDPVERLDAIRADAAINSVGSQAGIQRWTQRWGGGDKVVADKRYAAELTAAQTAVDRLAIEQRLTRYGDDPEFVRRARAFADSIEGGGDPRSIKEGTVAEQIESGDWYFVDEVAYRFVQGFSKWRGRLKPDKVMGPGTVFETVRQTDGSYLIRQGNPVLDGGVENSSAIYYEVAKEVIDGKAKFDPGTNILMPRIGTREKLVYPRSLLFPDARWKAIKAAKHAPPARPSRGGGEEAILRDIAQEPNEPLARQEVPEETLLAREEEAAARRPTREVPADQADVLVEEMEFPEGYYVARMEATAEVEGEEIFDFVVPNDLPVGTKIVREGERFGVAEVGEVEMVDPNVLRLGNDIDPDQFETVSLAEGDIGMPTANAYGDLLIVDEGNHRTYLARQRGVPQIKTAVFRGRMLADELMMEAVPETVPRSRRASGDFPEGSSQRARLEAIETKLRQAREEWDEAARDIANERFTPEPGNILHQIIKEQRLLGYVPDDSSDYYTAAITRYVRKHHGEEIARIQEAVDARADAGDRIGSSNKAGEITVMNRLFGDILDRETDAPDWQILPALREEIFRLNDEVRPAVIAQAEKAKAKIQPLLDERERILAEEPAPPTPIRPEPTVIAEAPKPGEAVGGAPPEGPGGVGPPAPAGPPGAPPPGEWTPEMREALAGDLNRWLYGALDVDGEIHPAFRVLSSELRAQMDRVGVPTGEVPDVAAAAFERYLFGAISDAAAPDPAWWGGVNRRTRELANVPELDHPAVGQVVPQVEGDATTLRQMAMQAQQGLRRKLAAAFGWRSFRTRVKDVSGIDDKLRYGVPATDALGARVEIDTWGKIPQAVAAIERAGLQVLGITDTRATPGLFGSRGVKVLVSDPDIPDFVSEIEIGTPLYRRFREATFMHERKANQIPLDVAVLEQRMAELDGQIAKMQGLPDPEMGRQIVALEKQLDEMGETHAELLAELTAAERIMQGLNEIVVDEIDAQHGGMVLGGMNRRAMDLLRLWNAQHVEQPMLESGFAEFRYLFDRLYYPIRKRNGAVFVDSDDGQGEWVGGGDPYAIDADRAMRGLPQPLYFPHMRPPPKLSDWVLQRGKAMFGARKLAENKNLKRWRGQLMPEDLSMTDPRYLTDVELAYQLRAARAIKARDTQKLVAWVTRNFGRKIADPNALGPGEVLYAPDFINALFKAVITIEDRMGSLLANLPTEMLLGAEFTRAEGADEAMNIIAAGLRSRGVKEIQAGALLKALEETAPKVKREFLALTSRGVDYYAIPKVVADRLEASVRGPLGIAQNSALRLFWDGPTNLWRAIVLYGRPAWLLNNFFGNLLFLKVQGGRFSDVVRQRFDPEFRDMLEQLAEQVPGTEIGFFSSTAEQYTSHLGVAGNEAVGEVVTAMKNAAQTSKGLRPFYKLGFHMKALNEYIENAFRRAGLARAIETEMNPEAITGMARRFWADKKALERVLVDGIPDEEIPRVLEKVNRFFGDFSQMSPMERHVIRRFLFPFWGFYRHVIRLFTQLPSEYPGRFTVIRMIEEATEDMVAEFGPLPEWMAGAVPFGGNISESGDTRFISSAGPNPFNVLTDSVISMLHPAAKIAMERATGRDAFTGRPFTSPDVVTPFGSDQPYQIVYDSQGRPVDAQPVDKVVPPWGVHLMGQVPQYDLVKNLLAGGRTYDTEGILSSVFGGPVIDSSGNIVRPVGPLESVGKYLGISTYPFDVGGYQERLGEEREDALRYALKRWEGAQG